MRSKRWAFPVAATSALLLAGVAHADREKVQLTAAGQAAARRAVLERADVGTAPGWTKRTKTPDLSGNTGCSSFQPKQSDLVVVGAADVEWTRPGLQLESEAQVLQTPEMVKLDWQRTVLTPQLEPCLRSLFGKQSTPATHFVSLSRLAFPAVGTYTRAYRILFDVTRSSTTVHVAVDLVLVGRGHTEITLTTTSPLEAGPTRQAVETKLARDLAARAF